MASPNYFAVLTIFLTIFKGKS